MGFFFRYIFFRFDFYMLFSEWVCSWGDFLISYVPCGGDGGRRRWRSICPSRRCMRTIRWLCVATPLAIQIGVSFVRLVVVAVQKIRDQLCLFDQFIVNRITTNAAIVIVIIFAGIAIVIRTGRRVATAAAEGRRMVDDNCRHIRRRRIAEHFSLIHIPCHRSIRRITIQIRWTFSIIPSAAGVFLLLSLVVIDHGRTLRARHFVHQFVFVQTSIAAATAVIVIRRTVAFSLTLRMDLIDAERTIAV